MDQAEIASHNQLQPNRMFILRGQVQKVEKELHYTRVVLNVINYDKIATGGLNDAFTLFFTGESKKVADSVIERGVNIVAMGTIIIKKGKMFLDGKIIELTRFQTPLLARVTREASVEDTNYEAAY